MSAIAEVPSIPACGLPRLPWFCCQKLDSYLISLPSDCGSVLYQRCWLCRILAVARRGPLEYTAVKQAGPESNLTNLNGALNSDHGSLKLSTNRLSSAF